MKAKIIAAALLLTVLSTFGQQSGNRIIRQYTTSNNKLDIQQPINQLYLTDSTFIIEANVLINTIADNYVATFGVSESSELLVDANTKIDIRIQNFIAALKKTGIVQSDIYIDMTTQTQIADYKAKTTHYEQYISGYEQKKNVIVKFKNIKELDRMVIIASEYGIYDLAKVDYIITDINKVYIKLFEKAVDIITSKKELYVKATNLKLKTSSQIYGEAFYSLYPEQLYKNYTPDISTAYYTNYGSRKDLKKNTTYYYDKINYSSFDNIINPIIIEPSIETVLRLQIKFDIEKSKN